MSTATLTAGHTRTARRALRWDAFMHRAQSLPPVAFDAVFVAILLVAGLINQGLIGGPPSAEMRLAASTLSAVAPTPGPSW